MDFLWWFWQGLSISLPWKLTTEILLTPQHVSWTWAWVSCWSYVALVFIFSVLLCEISSCLRNNTLFSFFWCFQKPSQLSQMMDGILWWDIAWLMLPTLDWRLFILLTRWFFFREFWEDSTRLQTWFLMNLMKECIQQRSVYAHLRMH